MLVAQSQGPFRNPRPQWRLDWQVTNVKASRLLGSLLLPVLLAGCVSSSDIDQLRRVADVVGEVSVVSAQTDKPAGKVE